MAIETTVRSLATTKISYEEFLHWPGENQHVEWVDGEVIEMSPVTARHQDIVYFLLSLLRMYAKANNAGRVLFDPFQMKTGAELPGRAPDIIFVATENLGHLHELYLDGPADIVVEVISPGSRRTDRIKKYHEYESGGVREYWLIDPEREVAEFYLRDAEGIFRLMPLTAGEFHSDVLKGLRFPIEVLWQDPLPDAAEILSKL